MITSRYHGVIRLHFVLKLAGGLMIFWGLVWALHLLVYGDELHPGNYHYISLLIPFAAFLEIGVREKSSRSLCGVSRAQIWNVTQREILFALVAIFGVIVMSKDPALSRVFLAAFMLLYSAWIAWMNQVGHRILQRRLFSSRSRHANTIVVAPPAKIERENVLQMTGNLPGAELLGYVPYGGAAAIDIPSFPFLGDFDNIRQICRSCHAKLVVALGLDNNPSLVKSLQEICDSQGMRLIWVEDQKERFGGNIDSHQSGSHLFLTNWQEALEDPLNRGIKRAFDVFASGLVTVLVLPFLCAGVWILHRLFSPGPLFYTQQRTGRDGEVFEMLKFRSMNVNDMPGVQAKVNDPRIFKGGDFLRKSSLDEMPQFFNVLKGEMSIVGPRPHFIDHDEKFAEIVKSYPVRQFAKPGITGLAQVKGCRGETDTERKVRQRVRFDHFYLRHWSPLLDLCIIFDTAVQTIFPPKSAR